MKAHVVIDRPSFTVDVHIEAGPSETVAIVGPNGAGKTSILTSIAGLFEDRSQVKFDVDDARVGVVFQGGLLFPNMTVRENVEFGSTASVDWLLEQFALTGLENQKPDNLSGGEAQKVALARTLASNPNVLLLDEPLSALDASSKIEVRRFLKSVLSDFQGPRIVVTHDPIDAFGLAERIYVVERGRVAQVGSPEDLRSAPATGYVADLVGTNLLEGDVTDGAVVVGQHHIITADVTAHGPVFVQIHPRAVAIHTSRPVGSARNVWQSVVDHIEVIEGIARVTFTAPLPLTAEVTTTSINTMDLDVGSTAYVAIKATEVEVRAR